MKTRVSAAMALAGLLAFFSVSRMTHAAAAKAAGEAPAQKVPCDAKCRQDHQGNASAIDACIRNCGSTGPTPAPVGSINLNSSRSNASRVAAPNGSTRPTPAPVGSINLNSSRSNASRVASPTTAPPEAKFHGNGLNQSRAAASSASGAVTSVDAAAKTISLTRKDGSVIVLDASSLASGLPRIGQHVSVKYTRAAGKSTAQSIAVTDPRVPPEK